MRTSFACAVDKTNLHTEKGEELVEQQNYNQLSQQVRVNMVLIAVDKRPSTAPMMSVGALPMTLMAKRSGAERPYRQVRENSLALTLYNLYMLYFGL